MKKYHQETNATAKIRTTVHLMITAKQVILYIKCIASTTLNPDKIYLGTAKENFKKRYYNHKASLKNRENANHTTLSKYLWEIKDKYKETPSLK